MDNLYKQIGHRIARLRKEHHMTQEQFAEALDISIKHCSCIERGVSSLSLEKLIDVCDIFDTNMDYLVRGETYTSLGNIPPSFIEHLKRSDEEEQQLIRDYLSLYAKIRNTKDKQ